jgi:3-hydroxybutyryl-CoA dehydratase
MRDASESMEQVVVGERFSREHIFSAEEVMAFAMKAGDDNPLHHDAEFASATRFGGLIVSGTHTTALLLGLTASHFAKRGTVVGLGFSVSFQRPVLAQERVTLEWVVRRVRRRSKGGGQIVDMTGCLRNERGDACVAATGAVLVGVDLCQGRGS